MKARVSYICICQFGKLTLRRAIFKLKTFQFMSSLCYSLCYYIIQFSTYTLPCLSTSNHNSWSFWSLDLHLPSSISNIIVGNFGSHTAEPINILALQTLNLILRDIHLPSTLVTHFLRPKIFSPQLHLWNCKFNCCMTSYNLFSFYLSHSVVIVRYDIWSDLLSFSSD